jgi:hypothetical protein
MKKVIKNLVDRVIGNYTTSIAYSNRNQSHVVTPFISALGLDSIHINQLLVVKALIPEDPANPLAETYATLVKLGFVSNTKALYSPYFMAMYNSDFSIELHLCPKEKWSYAVTAYNVCKALGIVKDRDFLRVFTIIENNSDKVYL